MSMTVLGNRRVARKGAERQERLWFACLSLTEPIYFSRSAVRTLQSWLFFCLCSDQEK